MSKLEELKVENDEQEKHLFYKNLKLLREMKLYLRSKNIDDLEFEDTRRDLIEMALQAQLRGESFEEILGRDSKEFCDELLSFSGKKNMKSKMKGHLQSFIAVIIVMCTINIVVSAFNLNGDIRNFRFPLSVGFLSATAIVIIIGGVIMNYFGKFALNQNRRGFSKTNLLSAGLMITMILAGYVWFILRDSLILEIGFVNCMWIIPLAIVLIWISKERKGKEG